MSNDAPIHRRLEIGHRLRRFRKRRGLTQTELAAELGLKSAYRVNQLELGRSRLYADELKIVCKLLDCSPLQILYAEKECDEAEILVLLQGLERRERELFRDLMRLFSNRSRD